MLFFWSPSALRCSSGFGTLDEGSGSAGTLHRAARADHTETIGPKAGSATWLGRDLASHRCDMFHVSAAYAAIVVLMVDAAVLRSSPPMGEGATAISVDTRLAAAAADMWPSTAC